MQSAIVNHRLANGLRLVMLPNGRVPVAGLSLWYAVGSAHERPGHGGFAHLFEHLMFQGSANVAKGQHFGMIQSAGGRTNAYTGLDATVYNDVVPSGELELALWLEADRMATLGSAITPEKLANQQSVVQNERRKRVDNAPYGSWEERSFPLAFLPDHPYHHSAWGSLEELSAASLQDVQQFFATYYLPGNAVMVLAGDLDPAATVELVERHFAAIPAGADPPPPPGRADAVGSGGNRAEVLGEGPLPRLYVACTAPSFGDAGYHAVELTVDLLATGRASRLPAALIRERRLAQAVEAWTTELRLGASLILIEVTGRPGLDPAQLEAAVDEELGRLATDPPSAEELDRVRTHRQTRRATLWQRAGDRADRIGLYACLLGDARLAFTESERDLAVRSEDVAQVARTSLAPSRRNYLWYLP